MGLRTWIALLLGIILLAGASAGRAAPPAAKPVRALMVLVGGNPHDVEINPPLLDKALKAAGIQVTKLAPPAGQPTSGAHLSKLADLKPGAYDVAVFYTVGQALNPQQEAALQAFVESGGGIVAIHGASASFTNSDRWFRMLGGRFSGHAPGTFTLPITIADPAHPIMKGIKEFAILDEEYCHRFPEGVERHVLARFKQRPVTTTEKNGNNDAVWTVDSGKGRVVYSALGHGEEAWKNPVWQKLIVQSILWAAGKPREVKVPQ